MVDSQVIQLSLALEVVSCGSFAFSYLRHSVRPEGDGPGLAGGEGELWGVHRVLVIYSSGDDSDLVVQKASSLRVPSKDDMIHVYGITFYTNSVGGEEKEGSLDMEHDCCGMLCVFLLPLICWGHKMCAVQDGKHLILSEFQ